MAKLVLLLLLTVTAHAQSWNHSEWDALLKRHVTPESRVDYQAIRTQSLPSLDRYLQRLAAPWPKNLTTAERKASLINAYNALTIRWIIQHYPVESIWRTKQPFTAARHTVDGKKVSLDGIETQLRNQGDPRVHTVLVCAARSCPPLRREAYTGERLEEQLTDNTRTWLDWSDRNRFDSHQRTAEVSKIFDWYGKDFDASGGVRAFLARYAPPRAAFLRDGRDYKLRYLGYHWGLNDTTNLGREYGNVAFSFDYLRNK